MPRLHAAVRVYLFSLLGVFLLTAPWTPVWSQAAALLGPTAFGDWVRGGWIRGAVSGIGAVDLLVASQDVGELWRSLRGGGGGNAA